MPSQSGAADLGASGSLRGRRRRHPGDGDMARSTAIASRPCSTCPKRHADRVTRSAPIADACGNQCRAHVEAHGPLAALAATARLQRGAVRVDATAEIAVTGALSASALHRRQARRPRARSRRVAPASDLNASVDIRAAPTRTGSSAGHYAIASRRGCVAGAVVPRGDAARGLRADAGRGLASTRPAASSHFPADLGIGGTRRAPGLGDVARHDADSLEASARSPSRASIAESSTRTQRSSRLVPRARLADPQLSATLEATGVRAGGYSFRSASRASRATVARERVGRPWSAPRLRSACRPGPSSASRAPVRASRSVDVDLREARAPSMHTSIASSRPEATSTSWAHRSRASARRRGPRCTSVLIRSSCSRTRTGSSSGRSAYLLGSEQTLRKGRVCYVVDVTAHRRRPLRHRGRRHGQRLLPGHRRAHRDTSTPAWRAASVLGAVELRADGIGALHVDPMNVELAGDEPPAAAPPGAARPAKCNLTASSTSRSSIDALAGQRAPLAGASGMLKLAGHVEREKGVRRRPGRHPEPEDVGPARSRRGARPTWRTGQHRRSSRPRRPRRSGIDVR